MTSTSAVAIALSLLINKVTLLDNINITEDNAESKLVFLLGVCILLRRVSVLPYYFVTKLPVWFMIEVPLALAILETSVIYVWEPIKEYILSHSEDILIQLYDDLDFIICPLCCGKGGCAENFASFLLKVGSFAFMFITCYATRK